MKWIYRLWMSAFAPRDWEAIPDANNPSTWIMRRWNGKSVEYRQPTKNERDDAYFYWATK